MWILLDNYDSFTRILHHYLLLTGHSCAVFRNDAISVEELKRMEPSRIIISPGPGTPLQAGICMEVIEAFHREIPILGVCLGHQAIGMHFGAALQHAPEPMHGKKSLLSHDHSFLFRDIPSPFQVMRYHSLVLDIPETTPLSIHARSCDDDQIMAFSHPEFPCVGVQFHPESIGSCYGMQLIRNWAMHPFR